MKRLFAWLSGAVGGIALYRLFERRSGPVAELEPAGPDPRAEALRARLEERVEPEAAVAPEPEPDSTAQPEPEPVEHEPIDESDPDARRRRVHEQGRAAVHRMRDSR
jgi:hypothetical protein